MKAIDMKFGQISENLPLKSEYSRFRDDYFKDHKTLMGIPSHDEYVEVYVREMDIIDEMAAGIRKTGGEKK